jgi:UDP-N-acetyl-D-galactosamine dehydrogenase
MLDKLLKKENKLAVIGLGYVGLPIALKLARTLSVVGFDINQKRVDMMRNHEDPSGELPASEFEGCDIEFTAQLEDLRKAQFYIVAVPTPIDEYNKPDLTPVIKASETLAKVLKKGDYVVYESTVYPGCTEEDCIPILEKSGLKYIQDFKVGYSPERINPGDHVHTLTNTVKIVSGCDAESLEVIHDVYALVIEAGLHKAPTLKVAEAAKIIENTQRDLNIALMNELSQIFNIMGINTFDVIEAAGTKWNFQKFQPGLVGGHCIGVDPYYLTWKAAQLGYHAKTILSGRAVNDSMGAYVAQHTIKKLIATGKPVKDARVLVMGITFKEDVQDIRNSKVLDIINELKQFHVAIDVVDPFAVAEEVHEEYHLELKPAPEGKYDAIIVAVPHKPYRELQAADLEALANGENSVLVDVKGLYRHQTHRLSYFSL